MSLHGFLRFVCCPFTKCACLHAQSRLSLLAVRPLPAALRAAQSFCWIRRSPPPAIAAPRSPSNGWILKNVDPLSTDHDDQGESNKLIIPREDRDASEVQKIARHSSNESVYSTCFNVTLNREHDPSSVFTTSGKAGSPIDTVKNLVNNTGSWCADNQQEKCTVSNERCHLKQVLNVNLAVPRNDGDQNVRWFPYLDQFRIGGETLTSAEILQMLTPFLSEERRGRIERAAANRTYSVCPVVEGLCDLGNIAAVFRSAEALGFQSVHIISNETTKRYKKNRKVSMGTEKWLDAEVWGATKECLRTLQSRGYRIAVAHVADDAASIFDIDWTVPTAVVFGNENRGVSIDAQQMSDVRCSIPMRGMVDSFNVSVAAGIVLHHAVHDRIARLGKHGDLSLKEQKILSADFYLRHNSKTSNIVDWLLQKKQGVQQTTLTSVLRGELEVDIEIPEYLKTKNKTTAK